MNKLMTLMATAALALVGWAEEMTYVPQGGENLWSDTSAWRIGGAAAARVPTAADDVSLFGAWTASFPLTVSTGSAATANTIGFGNAISGSAGDVVHMKIEGSLATASTFATNVWGVAGVTSVVTIAEGASFTGAGCDWIGATAGSRTVITNNGTMTFNDFHLVETKGAEASIDNYGSIAVNGDFLIGARASKGPIGLGRLHLHPGSTLTKGIGEAGAYAFLRVGSGVPGELVVENKLQLRTGDQIQLGLSPEVEGHLLIQGDGMVTNAAGGTLNVIVGNAEGAIGRLTMRDNARLFVCRTTTCLEGATEENSQGYLTMSGKTVIGGRNSGFSFGTGANSHTEFNLSDEATIESPATFPIATGEGATGRIVLSDNAGLISKTHLQFGGVATALDLCISNNAYISASRQHLFLSEPGCTGTGTVTMAGGQIRIYPRKVTEYVPFLFGSEGATAVLRGYGSFAATGGVTVTTARSCAVQLRGKMIASGFGTPQDLDASMLTMSNAVDEVNANGNSGWYAENGGRLHYPHTIAMTESGEVTIGDNNDRALPELVNSFHVKLTGMSAGHYLFAALYAPDRAEVPALPALGPKDVVLGCWNMGYASGGQFTSVPVSEKAFESAEVTIRHATDFAVPKKLKDFEIVAYCCREGGTWIEIARQAVDTTNPRLTLPKLSRDASGTCYNIGWIALVARYNTPGLMLLFK